MQATAYPLQWPAGWPRTQTREKSRFQTTLPAALKFLKKEVELLGGEGLVLSSNVTLGSENPSDVGVCAYFVLKKQNLAIPCDRWNRVECNVKAIGLTIEAMRGMERWGAKHMIQAMFSGFKALPAKSQRSFWEVLELKPGGQVTEQVILDAYRYLAKFRHPDVCTGSTEAFNELCEAKDLALSTIRNIGR